MSKVTYSAQSTCLMRIDSTKKIERCYNEKTIQFGCAANWIDYEIKKKNQAIGDIFECVFAHLEKGDLKRTAITDKKGNPMGDHLWALEDERDGSFWLRLIPTILEPAICFFSFNAPQIVSTFDRDGQLSDCFIFDADSYREYMGYKSEESSFLLITNLKLFAKDLMDAIPVAVKKSKENLTSRRFYSKFNPKEPVRFSHVDYHKYPDDSPFFCFEEMSEALFWKLPNYEGQSELRFAIPNINFEQTYSPNKSYDYKRNILDVYLPNFQNYTCILPANKTRSFLFYDIDRSNRTSRFIPLNLTPDEINAKIEKNNGKLIL